eukprot:GHVU01034326.1.p1 GENE.GHVU01034326.1~~GHVU01034326.1.p1  ORF type:complete len:457 (-),score=45.20 GHVU01034326.1:543-1784(-)
MSNSLSDKLPSYYMALDCLVRTERMPYWQAVYATKLFSGLLPVILPVSVTFIVLPIVLIMQAQRKKTTDMRLALLGRIKETGLDELYNKIHDELENDRILTIFRYIPMPGETFRSRVGKYFGDMVPMYIVAIFFLYSSSTTTALSLMTCQNYAGTSHLQVASSVICGDFSEFRKWPRFLITGAALFLLCAVGIPMFSFIQLFRHRKNLNGTSVRLKYGFLHNGYEKSYWYWETLIFVRKCIILMISQMSSSGSGAAFKLELGLCVAVPCMILQFTMRPFDKRSYSVLDRLEGHSLAVWNLTLSAALVRSAASHSHTHTRSHKHPLTHTPMLTHTHALTHALTQTPPHSHTYTLAHAHTLSSAHTHVPVRTRTHTHNFSFAHTHTHVHPHTNTHVHTHTHGVTSSRHQFGSHQT